MAGVPESNIGVVVHPTVLLSIVDHYTRVSKGIDNRVVGVILGYHEEGELHVTNSFALPFDEKEDDVWYLDHKYLESMYKLFRKISPDECIIGWYFTVQSVIASPRWKSSDMQINRIIRKYIKKDEGLILQVNVDLGVNDLDFDGINNNNIIINNNNSANREMEMETEILGYTEKNINIKTDKNNPFFDLSNDMMVFKCPGDNFENVIVVPFRMGCGFIEAESVGVEHLLSKCSENLLRFGGYQGLDSKGKGKQSDISNSKCKSLSWMIEDMNNSHEIVLSRKIQKCVDYLDNIVSGKLQPNRVILSNIQQIVNSLPSFTGMYEDVEMAKSLNSTINDSSLVTYTSVLLRTINALHSLSNNKMRIT